MRAAARGRLTRSNGKEFGLHDRPAECVRIGERVLSNDGSVVLRRGGGRAVSSRGDGGMAQPRELGRVGLWRVFSLREVDEVVVDGLEQLAPVSLQPGTDVRHVPLSLVRSRELGERNQ